MSGYYYKGISLSEICENNGTTTVDGYSGMPASLYPTNPNLSPLPFGYMEGNPPRDLCYKCTAYSNTISTKQEIPIKPGAKLCRVISVGGAGGGGGHGGKANVYSVNGTRRESFGGPGGMGGYGKYTYNNSISLVNYNSITITVGDGGEGGGSGYDPDSKKSNYNAGNVSYNKATVTGGVGGAGSPGNSSYIVLNGTDTPLAVADGGNGGTGGTGGYAEANEDNLASNAGDPGVSGNTTTAVFFANYPTLDYGNPSTIISVDGGGTGGGQPGTGGAVRIFWLYE